MDDDAANLDTTAQQEEAAEFSRASPAPFIYSAQFNNKNDIIMAGGAGANQVRLFDYESGNLLTAITDMPRAILSIANSNTSNDFAFGSCDSKIRIMSVKD